MKPGTKIIVLWLTENNNPLYELTAECIQKVQFLYY